MVNIDELDLFEDDLLGDERDQLLLKFNDNISKLFPGYQVYRMKDWQGGTPVLVDLESAEKYNTMAVQNAIFFTPNGDFESSGWVRKKESATKINCFVIDRDDSPTNKVCFWEWFPLKPTLIVETYKGYHAYRCLNTSHEFAKDGERWDKIQSWLCEELGWDKKAKDIARLFRMPWYNYWKPERKQLDFKTSVVDFDPERVYKFSDFWAMYQKFHNVERESNSYTLHSQSEWSSWNFDRINRELNVIDVLNEFTNRYTIRGNTIYEDWKATDWYKYSASKNFLVCFSAHERPQWWPFSVAKFFLWSDAETFKYFAEKHNIWEWKTKKMKVTSKKEMMQAIESNAIVTDTWSEVTVSFGGNQVIFSYTDRKIYKIVEDKPPVEILDWVFRVKWFFKRPTRDWTENIYIAEYEKLNETTGDVITWEVFFHGLGNKDQLKKILAQKWFSIMMTWFDNSYMNKYIFTSTKEYEVITEAWIRSKDLYINKPWVYTIESEDNSYIVSITDIKPSNREKNVIFEVGDKMDHEEFLDQYNMFVSTYHAPISKTVFLMYMMGMCSYYIRSNISVMPLLQLNWLSQSGKTTLKKLCRAIFGIDECLKTTAWWVTQYALNRMTLSYLPISIEEFENAGKWFDWDMKIKSAFDGSQEARGRKDWWVDVTAYNAMYMIDGETRSMTNSVYTRTIGVQCAKKHQRWLTSPDSFRVITRYIIDNYDKVYRMKWLLPKYRQYLTHELEYLKRDEKWRIIENYAMVLAIAECFWLIDDAREDVLQQCKDQLNLMGSNNLENIISKLLSSAKIRKMPMRIVENNIEIEFIVDSLSINKNLLHNAISEVVTINNYFYPDREANQNRLVIPLDHLFKTKSLHSTLNSALNYIVETYWTPDPQEHAKTRLAIKEYAKSNWYTTTKFYEMIDSDHGEYYESRWLEKAKERDVSDPLF